MKTRLIKRRGEGSGYALRRVSINNVLSNIVTVGISGNRREAALINLSRSVAGAPGEKASTKQLTQDILDLGRKPLNQWIHKTPGAGKIDSIAIINELTPIVEQMIQVIESDPVGVVDFGHHIADRLLSSDVGGWARHTVVTPSSIFARPYYKFSQAYGPTNLPLTRLPSVDSTWSKSIAATFFELDAGRLTAAAIPALLSALDGHSSMARPIGAGRALLRQLTGLVSIGAMYALTGPLLAAAVNGPWVIANAMTAMARRPKSANRLKKLIDDVNFVMTFRRHTLSTLMSSALNSAKLDTVMGEHQLFLVDGMFGSTSDILSSIASPPTTWARAVGSKLTSVDTPLWTLPIEEADRVYSGEGRQAWRRDWWGGPGAADAIKLQARNDASSMIEQYSSSVPDDKDKALKIEAFLANIDNIALNSISYSELRTQLTSLGDIVVSTIDDAATKAGWHAINVDLGMLQTRGAEFMFCDGIGYSANPARALVGVQPCLSLGNRIYEFDGVETRLNEPHIEADPLNSVSRTKWYTTVLRGHATVPGSDLDIERMYIPYGSQMAEYDTAGARVIHPANMKTDPDLVRAVQYYRAHTAHVPSQWYVAKDGSEIQKGTDASVSAWEPYAVWSDASQKSIEAANGYLPKLVTSTPIEDAAFLTGPTFNRRVPLALSVSGPYHFVYTLSGAVDTLVEITGHEASDDIDPTSFDTAIFEAVVGAIDFSHSLEQLGERKVKEPVGTDALAKD